MAQKALTRSAMRDGNRHLSCTCGERPCITKEADAEDVEADDVEVGSDTASLLRHTMQCPFCPGRTLRQL